MPGTYGIESLTVTSRRDVLCRRVLCIADRPILTSVTLSLSVVRGLDILVHSAFYHSLSF